MKITMVTSWTRNIEWFATASIGGKRTYARRRGYNFVAVEGVFDTTRRPHWSKISLILAALPHCDWVFWTDADSFIVNHDLQLESYVDEGYDLIVSGDTLEPERFTFNMGNIFVKNSEWARDFLLRCYAEYGGGGDEQPTVERLYRESADVKEHIKIVPNADFNVLWRAVDSRPVCREQLRFIVHFAGTQRYIPWLLEKTGFLEGICEKSARDARRALPRR